MPRLISSLSRIVKFCTLSWLALVALWAFLPSPTIRDQQQRHEYIQQTLTSGDVLRTIYRFDPLFSADSVARDPQTHMSYPDGCSSLLVDWRLVFPEDGDEDGSGSGSADLTLEIGRDPRTRVSLSDAILRVQGGVNGQNPSLYISDEITAHVDAGDEDHLINLPWFHWPDATLFYNYMHGTTYDVQLRVVARRDTGTVEIWKSASLIEFERHQIGIETTPLNVNFDQLSASERADGLLASFSDVHPKTAEAAAAGGGGGGEKAGAAYADRIKVADMPNAELPSKTYRTRSLILVPLAPSLTVVLFLFLDLLTPMLSPVLLPVLGAYILAVLICWTYHIYHSRRAAATRYDHEYDSIGGGGGAEMGFADWCSRFWLTRPVCSLLLYCCCCCLGSRRGRRDYRYHRYWPGEKSERVVIWGPAGPVYEE